MQRWAGKIAIVTGAAVGIGAAIAERLVREGLQVVGLDCQKERLDNLASSLSDKGGKLYAVQADLTVETDILNAFKWIKKNVGPVHILINNAGVFKHLEFLSINTEDAKAVLDLNVVALTLMVRETLNVFRENAICGYIININSLSGHYVINSPGFGVYAASKFAVTALTEALYHEVERLKMDTKVTSISPSFVNTQLGTQLFRERLTKIPFFAVLNPEDVAEATVFVLSTHLDCQIDEVILSAIYTKK